MAEQETYLDVTRKNIIDNSIKGFKYVDYSPDTISLNDAGFKNIRMQDTEGNALLEESELIIELSLTKADGSKYAEADVVGIVHNGPMFLFNSVVFKLGDKIIEQYNNAGIATTVHGFLVHGDNFAKAEGSFMAWVPDIAADAFESRKNLFQANNSAANKGKCKFIIPFNHIFGFQGKIITGITASVELDRKTQNNAIHRAAAAAEGKIDITRLIWRIPYVELNRDADTQLLKHIANKAVVEMAFLSKSLYSQPLPETSSYSWNLTTLQEKDRLFGIILFFQTARDNNQVTNCAIFDNCSLTNAQAMLNKREYPGIDLSCNYNNGGFMECYKRFLDFRKKFTDDCSDISASVFKSSYPFIVFDVSKQEERLGGHVITVQISMKFSTNVSANTIAYALLLSERQLSMQYLGDKKMNFLY